MIAQVAPLDIILMMVLFVTDVKHHIIQIYMEHQIVKNAQLEQLRMKQLLHVILVNQVHLQMMEYHVITVFLELMLKVVEILLVLNALQDQYLIFHHINVIHAGQDIILIMELSVSFAL